jgi:hypothetical protein
VRTLPLCHCPSEDGMSGIQEYCHPQSHQHTFNFCQELNVATKSFVCFIISSSTEWKKKIQMLSFLGPNHLLYIPHFWLLCVLQSTNHELSWEKEWGYPWVLGNGLANLEAHNFLREREVLDNSFESFYKFLQSSLKRLQIFIRLYDYCYKE